MPSTKFAFQADKRVRSSSLQAADSNLIFVFLLYLTINVVMLELPGFAVFVVLFVLFWGEIIIDAFGYNGYRCLMYNYIVTE